MNAERTTHDGLNLLPEPWLEASPLARAGFIRAAVDVLTRHADDIGDSLWIRDYYRGVEVATGSGQDGDWPHSRSGNELIAAVVGRAAEAFYPIAIADVVCCGELSADDVGRNMARAAISVCAGIDLYA